MRRHVEGLPGDLPETAHLAGVVAAVSSTGRPTTGLWMNLTAYAYFLEHEARLEESLEMLNLAARSQGSETPPNDFAAYALFAGRLNRLLARWDLASACYGAAEEAAAPIGDQLAVLRGRLGQGAVLRGQGNYPAARAAAEERRTRRRPSSSCPRLRPWPTPIWVRSTACRASSWMPSKPSTRHSGSVGKRHSGCARWEISRSVSPRSARSTRPDSLSRSWRNRMPVFWCGPTPFWSSWTSSRQSGNRVAFERFRVAAEEHDGRMSPSMAVDYQYKVGIGLARFGQLGRAKAALTVGLELAEQHKLNAWYFKIEQAVGELTARPDQKPASREASGLSEAPSVRGNGSGAAGVRVGVSRLADAFAGTHLSRGELLAVSCWRPVRRTRLGLADPRGP